MHIVHVINKSVPATGAEGGAPQCVTWLTGEQKYHGHQVSVISPSGKSTPNFQHIMIGKEMSGVQLGDVLPRNTDIVHLHSSKDSFELILYEKGVPFVTHIHGNHIGLPNNFCNRIYVSQSHAANHGATNYVYNGLPLFDYSCEVDKDDYLLFLGNVARGNKGVDTAIEIARRTGIRLVIAGGRRLACIETWLPIRRNIKSVGVVCGQAKIELIRRAKALIFPIRWEEPFGLVLIEAMACGTPVLAADRGAVREIVLDGLTGFIYSDSREIVDLIPRLKEIDSVACRRHVENNFTIEHTYAGCLTCYRRAIAGEVW